MRHKIISFIFALLFLVAVQSFNGVFRFLLAAMLVYLVALSGYNYWLLRSQRLYNFWVLIRPVFLGFSLALIYLILPGTFLKGLFSLGAVAMMYLAEATIMVISEQILYFETLLTYFGIAIGIFGFNFYLLPRTFFVLCALLLLTFFVSRASFENIPNSEAKRNFYSWLIGLLVMQLAWAVLFLPLHFTVLGVMIFNAFYVLWIITYYHLLHNLNAKKIAFHLLLALLIIILALIATPWKV